MYVLAVKPSASKELERLPRHIQIRFVAAIDALLEDPLHARPGVAIAPLAERKPEWKLRVGDYRGIFVIEGNYVRFLKFGHRSTIYR